MADYKFTFHEKGKEYNPAWIAPEGQWLHVLLVEVVMNVTVLPGTESLSFQINDNSRLVDSIWMCID